MQTTIHLQRELEQLLKRKSVGPRGSKHLTRDDLELVSAAMASDEVSIASKAVLVTSVIILECNKWEKLLLRQWKTGHDSLPNELSALFFSDPEEGFSIILHKILRGEDLSANEALSAIAYLLNSDVPGYQKGAFLIGERLKQESVVENSAFLQGMRRKVQPREVEVPLLVNLADPYDGFKRYPIYTPFTAALLAAIDIPAYCHGLYEVAPKYGVTTHKILKLANKKAIRSTDAVIHDIENDHIGWGYIDQSEYFSHLYGLHTLRSNIVKRSFLAILEKLLQPLRSPHSNYLVAGFVHQHYKDDIASLLKDQASLDVALVVKGFEGTSQVDFRKKSDRAYVREGAYITQQNDALNIAIAQNEWDTHDALAEYCLETGIAALKGAKNTARQVLINQAVQIGHGLQIMDESEAHAKAKKVLDSGKAFRHWQNGGM